MDATMDATTRQVVEDNMGLVGKWVKRYLGRGVSYDDLMQEGSLGLMEAASRFKSEVGKFSTYATWWIKRYLSLACRNKNEVTIPEYVFRSFSKIERARLVIGPDASDAQIIEYCEKHHPDGKVNYADAFLALRALNVGSLNLPSGEGERDAIGNLADHRRSTIHQIDVGAFLGTLTTREREIVSLRYGLESGEGMKLQEIGDKIGLTKERVRQIEQAAMKKMQEVA